MGNLATYGILDDSLGADIPGSGGDSAGQGLAASMPASSAPAHAGLLARAGQILTGIPGGLLHLGSDIARLPLAVADPEAWKMDDASLQHMAQRYPALAGIAMGAKQTGMEFRHPTTIAKNYSEDPLGAALNDAANLSLVGGLAAKGLGVGAVEGSARATVAGRLAQMGDTAGKVASIPAAPWRYAITSATEHLGQAAEGAVDAGRGGALTSALVRFSPNAKALQNVMLEGQGRMRNELGNIDPSSMEAGILRGSIRDQVAENISALPFTLRDGSQALDKTPTLVGGPTAPPVGPTPEAREAFLAKVRAGQDPTDYTAAARGYFDPSATRPIMQGPSQGYTSLADASDGAFGGKTAQQTLLKDSLAAEVRRLHVDPKDLPGSNALGQVLDPANRVYRQLRMNLNPGWAIGQVPGNAVMGAAQATAPLDYLREYGKAFLRKDYIDDGRINHTATKSVQTGPGAEPSGRFAKAAARVDERFPRLASAVKRVDAMAPALAERADNASRSGFYRSEMNQGASEAVARERTLRGMGEFDKRNAGEQAYVRRVAPFYTWNREVVKMTAHLAEDHPLRAAVLANLGRANADGRKGKPGSRVVDGSFLVPYGQSGGSFGGALFGAGKMLGPIPKFAAMVGTGDSMSSGKDLRVGQAFGQANAPGLHNSGAAVKTIAGGVPIGRFANAAKGENRYQTPGEAGISLLSGIDVSHNPSQDQLDSEKAGRAADRVLAKLRAGKPLTAKEKALLASVAAGN